MVLILEILFLVALAFTQSKKINYHYMLYHVMTPSFFQGDELRRGECQLYHQRQISLLKKNFSVFILCCVLYYVSLCNCIIVSNRINFRRGTVVYFTALLPSSSRARWSCLCLMTRLCASDARRIPEPSKQPATLPCLLQQVYILSTFHENMHNSK